MLKVAVSTTILAIACLAPLTASAASGPVRPKGCVVPRDNRIESPDFETPLCFPSPDGRKLAIVRQGRITVRQAERNISVGVTDNGRLVWNPASTGFAVADSGGSGQSSYFSYVDLRQRPPSRIKRLRWAAAQAFVRRFGCTNPKTYVYSWFDGWEDASHVRLVVQTGVHSEACDGPDPNDIQIGVIGDPTTGRIDRVLSRAEVVRTWCTAAQRREYGYCYVSPPTVHEGQ
jgi:hypothetical protein